MQGNADRTVRPKLSGSIDDIAEVLAAVLPANCGLPLQYTSKVHLNEDAVTLPVLKCKQRNLMAAICGTRYYDTTRFDRCWSLLRRVNEVEVCNRPHIGLRCVQWALLRQNKHIFAALTSAQEIELEFRWQGHLVTPSIVEVDMRVRQALVGQGSSNGAQAQVPARPPAVLPAKAINKEYRRKLNLFTYTCMMAMYPEGADSTAFAKECALLLAQARRSPPSNPSAISGSSSSSAAATGTDDVLSAASAVPLEPVFHPLGCLARQRMNVYKARSSSADAAPMDGTHLHWTLNAGFTHVVKEWMEAGVIKEAFYTERVVDVRQHKLSRTCFHALLNLYTQPLEPSTGEALLALSSHAACLPDTSSRSTGGAGLHPMVANSHLHGACEGGHFAIVDHWLAVCPDRVVSVLKGEQEALQAPLASAASSSFAAACTSAWSQRLNAPTASFPDIPLKLVQAGGLLPGEVASYEVTSAHVDTIGARTNLTVAVSTGQLAVLQHWRNKGLLTDVTLTKGACSPLASCARRWGSAETSDKRTAVQEALLPGILLLAECKLLHPHSHRVHNVPLLALACQEVGLLPLVEYWLESCPEKVTQYVAGTGLPYTPADMFASLAALLKTLEHRITPVQRTRLKKVATLTFALMDLSQTSLRSALQLGLLDHVLAYIAAADTDVRMLLRRQLFFHLCELLRLPSSALDVPSFRSALLTLVSSTELAVTPVTEVESIRYGKISTALAMALQYNLTEVLWYWLEHCPADVLAALKILPRTLETRDALMALLGPAGSRVNDLFTAMASSASTSPSSSATAAQGLDEANRAALAELLRCAAEGTLPGVSPSHFLTETVSQPAHTQRPSQPRRGGVRGLFDGSDSDGSLMDSDLDEEDEDGIREADEEDEDRIREADRRDARLFMGGWLGDDDEEDAEDEEEDEDEEEEDEEEDEQQEEGVNRAAARQRFIIESSDDEL